MATLQKTLEAAGSAAEAKRSHFDGSVLQLLGWRLLGTLVTLVSLGIAYPWAMCMVTRWEIKHTVLNGRRLKFTGKGIQLWGKYLLWGLLTVLTLGIYGVWFGLGMKKWQVKHTVYADEEDIEGEFTGSAGGWFVRHLLWWLLTVFTLGIGYAWGEKRMLQWQAEHTRIGGGSLTFRGTGGQLFGRYLLWGLLTVLTLGIYAFVCPVRYLKWKVSNTYSLACVPEYHQKSRSHEEVALRDSVKFAQADNDTQLERVKSGIIGEETEEELRAFAEIGNRSAMYELAMQLKEERFEGDSLEFLRSAALAGYHPAMLEYALYTGTEQGALYSQLLEGSATNGNPHAPWLLKLYYEEKAHGLRELNSYESADHLQKAAYWFKVAMERGDPDALANKEKYEKMLQTLALWFAERRERRRSRGGGWIVILIAAILILAAVAVWRIFFVKGQDAGETEPVSQVQLWCDERVVDGEMVLFQQVPWEPSVISFENLTLTNNGSETVTWQLELEGTQGVLMAFAIFGRVSEGDMERVMAQRDNFQSGEVFTTSITVEPGQSQRFALILYWPGGEQAAVPEGMEIPAQMQIRIRTTEE